MILKHKRSATGVILGPRTNLPTVERPIAGVVVVEEEHVDEGDEEAGGLPGVASIVRHPLVEDQDDQVAEEAGHEEDLRNEAQVDVQWLVEVPAVGRKQRESKLDAGERDLMTGGRSQHSQVVEEAETNSKEHVDDP